MSCPREGLFPAHVPMDGLLRGIKNKQYYRGVLRCKAGGRAGGGYTDCYVVVHSAKGKDRGAKKKDDERWSISITGLECVNRALDGDVVAVELIASSRTSTAIVSSQTKEPTQFSSSDLCVSDVTAEPSLEAIEGLAINPQISSTLKRKGGKPSPSDEGPVCGRVVGIIRRNWRQYAGAIVPLHTAKTISVEREGLVTAEDASELAMALFVPVDPKIPRVKISTRY